VGGCKTGKLRVVETESIQVKGIQMLRGTDEVTYLLSYLVLMRVCNMRVLIQENVWDDLGVIGGQGGMGSCWLNSGVVL